MSACVLFVSRNDLLIVRQAFFNSLLVVSTRPLQLSFDFFIANQFFHRSLIIKLIVASFFNCCGNFLSFFGRAKPAGPQGGGLSVVGL